MTEPLDINASLLSAFRDQPLSLSDLEAVRLVLNGDSIIDWNRANFRTIQEVDRYLRLHQLDISKPEDLWRLQYVHGEAVNYLEEHLGLSFPTDLQKPRDVREIFLQASHIGGFRRKQILACVLLKLMHVINHMEAAELRYQTPLSEADLMELAEKRIMSAAEKIRESGFPLVAFYGSRKARNSIITKLIAKRENIAATIFDKLRFRIVTHDREHILPAITWLTRNLFPFNYVIPGQSHNNLMLFRHMIRDAPFAELGSKLSSNGIAEDEGLTSDENPFSGGSYRMVNFIADFPVRIDHLVDVRYGALLGRTVFVMVEFQVIDRQTARENEEGENAHRLYKNRQRAIVQARLRKGGRRGRK
ncbi:MAG: TIGR04552 family protein [Myxococcota bacterium]|nr:TIGR04552 family protein [Myxococcota bacterium]